MSNELNPNGLAFQLQKVDEHNWQLFQWQDGGQKISRGRYAGQLTQAKWMGLESFHPRLELAAAALLEIAIRENTPDKTGLDTETVLSSIAAAKEQVLAAVEAVTPEEFSKKSKRGRKPKNETR